MRRTYRVEQRPQRGKVLVPLLFVFGLLLFVSALSYTAAVWTAVVLLSWWVVMLALKWTGGGRS